MYTLTIKGFKNKQQVEEFASWYCGQGEQNASIWFECRCEEGVLDVSTMNVDGSKMVGNWKIEDGETNLDLHLDI